MDFHASIRQAEPLRVGHPRSVPFGQHALRMHRFQRARIASAITGRTGGLIEVERLQSRAALRAPAPVRTQPIHLSRPARNERGESRREGFLIKKPHLSPALSPNSVGGEGEDRQPFNTLCIQTIHSRDG